MILGQNQTPKWIAIDEIQKLPVLLDEVHRLIEKRKWRFLLTGSSVRKLRKQHTNLLAGRAWNAELFSLHHYEISQFSLKKHLLYGSLPRVLLSKKPQLELKNYIQNYLYQEIQMEALVRNLPNFSRFLKGVAVSHCQILNFEKLGRDYALSPSVVKNYYSILEDTLIGFFVPPLNTLKSRKAVTTSKFYFFDLGLSHSLLNINELNKHSDLYGRAFEHFIALELKLFISYSQKNSEIFFFKNHSNKEVDFVVENTAVEVKSSSKVSSRDIKNLKYLKETGQFKNLLLVSQDRQKMNYGGVICLHWQDFLKDLWKQKFF